MNSRHPAALRFAFTAFAERGGRTGDHADGWGIAWHEGRGCRLIVDEMSSVESPLALAVKEAPLKARNVVAHVRKATQGRVARENSHPFVRRLWNRTWSFAHNGNLADFNVQCASFPTWGDTDSERAFCYLMAGLRARFPDGAPSSEEVLDALQALVAEVARHGTFNFLLSDGQALYAHCSTKLSFVRRQYPFAKIRLPEVQLDVQLDEHNHEDDRMTIIATEPLTEGEQWQALTPGELRLFEDGAPRAMRRAVVEALATA